MATRMQQRRGTALQWSAANPVLGAGEIGFETDTNQFKIGDGDTQWEDLAYFQNTLTLGGSLDDYVPLTQKGQADGVATLDENGQIPANQLAYVDQAVENVIGMAPEDLNTLVELAEAIGDDADFIGTINDSISAVQSSVENYVDTQLASYAREDGVVFTGSVVLNANPTQALEAATKSYVDTVAEGLLVKPAVDVATTANVSSTYSNGTNGVGATLTIAATATLDIDGKTSWEQYDSVLFKNQTNKEENGRYVLTTVGNGSTAWVFTRCGLCDEADEIPGAYMFVKDGTTNQGSGWVLDVANPDTFAVGTDDINVFQFSGAGTYLAGTGLELNGNTFSIDEDHTATRAYADNVAYVQRGNAVDDAAAYTDSQISDLSTTLGQDIQEVETDLTELASDVSTLSTTIGGQIEAIEGDITQISSDIATNTSDISSLTTDLGTLQATVATNTGNIADLETTLDQAVSDISTLTGTVSTNETTLNGLVTTVDGHTSDIATLLALSEDVEDLQTEKAPLESPSFTGTVVLPSTTSIGDVSSTEIEHLNGVTSGIQGQIDAKLDSGIASTTYAPINNPTFTGTVELPEDTSIGNVSSTELSYIATVTSNVQDQLDEKAPLDNPTFTGTVSGLTPAMVGLGQVDNTADADKPISTATQTALDAKLSLSGGTMTGKITLDSDPTQALHATTKQYVDNVSSGILAKPSVVAATTANLDATYSNGTAGVGATLTANSNGAFPLIDGVSVTTVSGQRGVLVKNQTDPAENGRYNLTTQGDENTPWVLTRCGLCDEANEIPGAYVFVTDGTVNGQTGWVQHVDDPATFTVGTDDIDVFQFAGAGSVTAGTNISVTGNEVSVLDAPVFSGVVDASASGVEFSDGIQTKQGVPSLTTISQKTDSYSLSSLGERDTIIEINKSTGTTLTIPLDSSVDYPVGTTIDIIQTGSGQVTIAGAGGVTVNATPGLKLRAQWSSATLLKRAANTWLVYGDLAV